MKDFLKSKYNLNTPELFSVIELPLWSAPFGLKLLETVKLKKNIKVLDIGFGLGFPLIELAMRLGNSCKVFGIDPWDAGIERTKMKIKVCKLSNVKITKGVAEELPYEDNFFELLVSNNGINNVTDLSKTLSECSRVSKKGAQFVFTMNLEDTMKEFYDVYEKVLKENQMFDEVSKMKEQIYSKRKPLTEMVALVKDSGFKINNIEDDSFFLRFTDAETMFEHFLINIGFLEGWIKILPEQKVEFIFTQVEKELNKISKKYKEIKLSIPFVTFDCSK